MNLLERLAISDCPLTTVGKCYLVTKKPRDLRLGDHERIPFVPMEAIPQDGSYQVRFTSKKSETLTSGTYFEKDDVLISKITPSFENGKQALASNLSADFGYATTEVIPLKPRSPLHDPRFLFFYLLHPDIRHHIAERMEGSTGRQRVPEETLLNLSMPSFSLTQQVKISNALETIQFAVQQEIQLEMECRTLKSSSMNAMFTRGLRGEAQKETEIGLMPEGWESKPLGGIAEIVYGAQAAVANETDPSIGTMILTNVNLDLDGNINLDKQRYYRIPEKHKERLSLRKGDVLFNWRSGSANHVGKTVYFDLDGDFTFSSFILRFRTHSSVSNKYLFRWLTYLRASGYFSTQRNVSSINSVYNASLSATIPIWFPPEEEQAEIVEILTAIDRKINLHKEKGSM